MFVCKHKTLMTKTVGLADDAYERLAALKGEDESFSDVVRRLTGAPLARRLTGSMGDETAQHYREVIGEARKRQDETRRDRIDELLGDDGDNPNPPPREEGD